MISITRVSTSITRGNECTFLFCQLYKVLLTFEPVDEILKAMDLSHDVTQYCDFLRYSLKQIFIYTN